MDFAVLPPEVNSGRMYAGPGSGSMLAAATAWEELANQLHATAASIESVISGLTSEPWQGPTAATAAAAAAPQMAWLNATAERATQAGAQAKAAAAAYESAHAMTVPPPEIAANRSQLTSLVATNYLGQNMPAIAATEVAYGEMWAQDVAAMYGYAGASRAASQVTPFTPPEQTTNQGGLTAQSAAVAQAAGTSAGQAQSGLPTSSAMSAVPNALQSLTSSSAGLSDFSSFANPYNLVSLGSGFLGDGVGLIGVSGAAGFISEAEHELAESGAGSKTVAAPDKVETPGAPRPPGAATTVSAGLGRASSLGGLSVPQGWSTAAPEIRLTGLEAPSATPASRPGPGLLGQMPLLGGAPLMTMSGGADSRDRRSADEGQAGDRRAVAAAIAPGRGALRREVSTGAATELREITDVLGKLADLRASGALTDTEFTEQKQRLLGTR
ncbi:PPE domain-containing protein [Mycobacterium marseillense]|uniref:PPE family protein, SVP subgroup n=1 Tax=Mycobacterium marseillense TaxID=701042 RepID=UPI0025961CFD|nr:PPE domain-containing protein [Mycobacterium marseillense]MDM3973712.1 PPE domain-containing protein [Mycobacterium marseillense]